MAAGLPAVMLEEIKLVRLQSVHCAQTEQKGGGLPAGVDQVRCNGKTSGYPLQHSDLQRKAFGYQMGLRKETITHADTA